MPTVNIYDICLNSLLSDNFSKPEVTGVSFVSHVKFIYIKLPKKALPVNNLKPLES